MGAFPEDRPSPAPQKDTEVLACPEDVDWIFDVDTLRSNGADALVALYGLEEAPYDCPHYPFKLSQSSSTVWDRTIRQLTMAAGEAHIVITGRIKQTAGELALYARVAGFRENGLPQVVASFQKIDEASYQSIADTTRQNWLYLLHEIKNPISILKASEDIYYNQSDPEQGAKEAAQARRFATTCLEDHLRNGVFLATEDSRMIPNNPEPTDLNLFFDDLRGAFQMLLRIQKSDLKIDLDIGSHQVARIDRTLLAQLMNNRLLNKINCLKEEDVSIECRLGSSRADGTGTLLIITISDEGPPFPDHVLQGLDREPDLKGLMDVHTQSGLGLPICRRIVAVMGGELKFYNDPPKTRIRIWLPLD